MSKRKELLQSAISFLSDESVRNAPLHKKVEFLQEKGLNDEELEIALKSALSSGNDTNVKSELRRPDLEVQYESYPAPLPPRRDWRDYFVIATATCGLLYSAYEVSKRYVLPHILPECQSKVEETRDELQSEFTKIDEALEKLAKDQAEFRERENSKMQELEETIIELNTCLQETTDTKQKLENEFKFLKLEINALQSQIEKLISGVQDSNQMSTIERELASLKTLILGPNAPLGGSPSPNKTSSPSIPGIDAVPKASEILAKMKIDINQSHDLPSDTSEMPSGSDHSSITNKSTGHEELSSALPDWQGVGEPIETTPAWQEGLDNLDQ